MVRHLDTFTFHNQSHCTEICSRPLTWTVVAINHLSPLRPPTPPVRKLSGASLNTPFHHHYSVWVCACVWAHHVLLCLLLQIVLNNKLWDGANRRKRSSQSEIKLLKPWKCFALNPAFLLKHLHAQPNAVIIINLIFFYFSSLPVFPFSFRAAFFPHHFFTFLPFKSHFSYLSSLFSFYHTSLIPFFCSCCDLSSLNPHIFFFYLLLF